MMNRRRFFLLGATVLGAPAAMSHIAVSVLQQVPVAGSRLAGSRQSQALIEGIAGAAHAAPAAKVGPATAALAQTDLIYLTPIHSSGAESRCQAEVWFVHDGSSIWVVTEASTWRARAIARNLRSARIWVGDVGPWNKSQRRYRSLPNLMARGQRITGQAPQELALQRFGSKYSGEWLLWGPRFRRGLANGSRALLQYDTL